MFTSRVDDPIQRQCGVKGFSAWTHRITILYLHAWSPYDMMHTSIITHDLEQCNQPVNQNCFTSA